MKRTAAPDIPGYRMLRALERGGMSEIWLAEQIALSRPVAIKLLAPGEDFEARVARFRLEAATIARFDHPNVVGIIEFGQTADGRLYYSMPYVPNGSLIDADLLGDSPRLRAVLSELLQALAYVHRHGVVHRDVKPENVLFDSVGRARLTDFGVSRIMTEASRRTRAGETFGSSYYMSPEQARGELPDGRSDLYSVGVLAYELLVGEPPFQGPDHLSIVIAHLQNPVPRLPEALRHWQGFIDTAMAKKPGQRFADAESMRMALKRIPDEPGQVGRVRRMVRNPAFALGAMVASAVGIVVTGALIGLSGRDPVPDAPAWSADERSAPIDLVYDEAAGAVVERREQALPPPADGSASSPPPPGADSTALASPAASAGENAGEEPARFDRSALDSARVEDLAASSPISDSGVEEPPAAAVAAPSAPPSTITPRPTAPNPARSATAARTPPTQTLAATIPDPGNFAEVPGVPLLILGGERDLRLQRIDALLELGRRNIERERARYAALTNRAEDRSERRQFDGELRTRERNYADWRRRVQELRRRAEND